MFYKLDTVCLNVKDPGGCRRLNGRVRLREMNLETAGIFRCSLTVRWNRLSGVGLLFSRDSQDYRCSWRAVGGAVILA